jgi:hypothetical protein
VLLLVGVATAEQLFLLDGRSWRARLPFFG